MYYTNPESNLFYDFWTRENHQRPWSSWLSLLQILQIDLLAYTGLFSFFAGLEIFFILTWKTREFDLNFAYEKFYFLLNQLLF